MKPLYRAPQPSCATVLRKQSSVDCAVDWFISRVCACARVCVWTRVCVDVYACSRVLLPLAKHATSRVHELHNTASNGRRLYEDCRFTEIESIAPPSSSPSSHRWDSTPLMQKTPRDCSRCKRESGCRAQKSRVQFEDPAQGGRMPHEG